MASAMVFLVKADSNLAVGVAVLLLSNLILAMATFVTMKRGWRIKKLTHGQVKPWGAMGVMLWLVRGVVP
jgi:hypothetical protein